MLLPTVTAQYEPSDVFVRINSDGTVHVKKTLIVDTNVTSLNVTTLGNHVSGVQVTDSEGRSLPKLQYRGYISVQTLGKTKINVNYTSTDLTEKSGTLWTFRATTSNEINIRLPEDATVYSISPNPTGLSGSSDNIYVTLPSGDLSVVYRIGIIGTKNHALTLIESATDRVWRLNSSGVKTKKIDAVLSAAMYAYSNKQYVQAEEYARKVVSMCDSIQIEYEVANRAIGNVEKAIAEADLNGITQPEEVNTKLDHAKAEFSKGNYPQATATAVDTIKSVVSELPEEPPGTEFGVLTAGGFLVVVVGYYLVNRGKHQSADGLQDDIIPQYTSLRFEDREIVKFLHTSEGAFMKELRERFDLPKSTTFRTIKRLEGMGVITVERVGRENYIKLTYANRED